MGKMEQTLKSEITRLARKEMQATYLPLARDVPRTYFGAHRGMYRVLARIIVS